LDCDLCPKGFSCLAASTTDNGNIAACPENHYCPEGTASGAEPEDKDIELVTTQTGCNREDAIAALKKNNNDIVEAIMSFSA